MKITLLARSSKGGSYEVTIDLVGEKITARCSCKAAAMGTLCKHRVALLKGDSTALADLDQLPEFRQVSEWVSRAGILAACIELAEAEKDLHRVQERIKKLKRDLLVRVT